MPNLDEKLEIFFAILDCSWWRGFTPTARPPIWRLVQFVQTSNPKTNLNLDMSKIGNMVKQTIHRWRKINIISRCHIKTCIAIQLI